MLIPQAMPDAVDGGKANTIEKVLDFRDVEVAIDEDGEKRVLRVVVDTAGVAEANDDEADHGGAAAWAAAHGVAAPRGAVPSLGSSEDVPGCFGLIRSGSRQPGVL